MRTLLGAILLVILGLFTLQGAWAEESHSGRVVMEFDLSGHPTGDRARLWIPYPVSDAYQVVSNISIKGDYDYAAVHTDRKFQNPILFVEWRPGAKSRKLRFSYRVTRFERRDKDLPKDEAPWAPADYRGYLSPTSLGPIDGPVAELASRITAGRSGVAAKAKAIYDWICDNMYRDPATKGCGTGDVCLLLERKGGKCVDLHSVFVALARAAGVPAREIFGVRQGKSGVTDITGWYHCWAEFYLPGYGWVVVDPADVTKAVLEKKLPKDHPEIMRLRDYFWGAVDPYRIRLAYGRDLVLNPAQEGGPINYLMYPFAQVGDKTLDWLEPDGFRYKVTHYSD